MVGHLSQRFEGVLALEPVIQIALDSSRQFVAASFRGLLYSWSKSRGRFHACWKRPPHHIISRGTFQEWPEAVRAIHLCARCPLCALSETRRAVWLDTPESTTSILIHN